MSNGNLVLHCGAHAVSINDVSNVRTPGRTDTHVPVDHIHLYELAQKHIAASGYRVVQEQHALHTVNARGTQNPITGANWFALIELESEGAEHGLVIGLRNSHAQQFAASIAIGSRVFVCDNLAFSGEVTIARKHTVNVLRDLPQCVAAAVGRINEQRVLLEQRIAAYKQKALTVDQADHLFCNLIRAKAIAANNIGPAIAEFDKPRHVEHLGPNGETTVWTAFNAITEVVTKGSNVFTLGQRTQALHGVCDAAAGLLGHATAALPARLEGVEDAEWRDAA